MNLGYACINMQLSYPQEWGGRPKGVEPITTNRSMIRRTYDAKGIIYASALSLKNCEDLEKIIDWNLQNGIQFYRMSSNVFPWASEHGIKALPDYDTICQVLKRCGDKAKAGNLRLTFHPGPFNKLTSPREQVVLNTIKDLEIHGETMDLMGLDRSPWAKINIHVGAHYNDKPMAIGNFCKNFYRLSDSVKSRLTVENDDKASLYSTTELYDGIYKRIGIPIVHDFHHHTFCTGGLSQEEALQIAISTWGDIKPVTHYSQSRAVEYNDTKIKANAHSDSYWEPVNTYGQNIDVMLECKHKEIGLMQMRLMRRLLNETR